MVILRGRASRAFCKAALFSKSYVKGVIAVRENRYRTLRCGEVCEDNLNTAVRVAGWVENIRDHGGILFLDLRDQTGLLQVVIPGEAMIAGVTRESTVSVEGTVVKRSADTVNEKIATGTVEVKAAALTLLGRAKAVPFEVADSLSVKEDLRLRYRFLDLRNPEVHDKIALRARVMSYLRREMEAQGFTEIQTPILTASSPEGARDYLIPSRKHRGKFYALPQAPQIFKQLLMASGFDRYYQIAPCFRDEDARADRSPGEFYQLDFELAFAEQDDVFEVAERVVGGVFRNFSKGDVNDAPYPRIPYAEAMLRYGTDKPDLRNPLEIFDISDLFCETDFAPFRGKCVRAISVPGAGSRPRSFFEGMLDFATSIGMKGLGYVKVNADGSYAGPIDKFLSDSDRVELRARGNLSPDDVLYFIADSRDLAPRLAGQIRTELGERMGLIDREAFRLCFVVDFPMYELSDETGNWDFTHNPFSMPQGGLAALQNQKPDEILAYQYDIVCNGVELSSGAVRNHDIETMVAAFELAGYTAEDVETRFGALYTAFQYGAPPHAGMAPGIDRLVMLLTGDDNIREVIAFPMNNNAQDVLMGAPCEVSEKQLREVHIKLR